MSESCMQLYAQILDVCTMSAMSAQIVLLLTFLKLSVSFKLETACKK